MNVLLENYNKPEKLEEEITTFVKDWQKYQDDIKVSYDEILRIRGQLMYVFYLSALLYFIDAVVPGLAFGGTALLSLAHIVFALGFINLGLYLKQSGELKKQITRYELSRPTSEDNRATIKEIKNKISGGR